jgi:hypothetical protein
MGMGKERLGEISPREVSILANIAKLSMALLEVQSGVEKMLASSREVEERLGEISLNFDELCFSLIVQRFWEII